MAWILLRIRPMEIRYMVIRTEVIIHVSLIIMPFLKLMLKIYHPNM